MSNDKPSSPRKSSTIVAVGGSVDFKSLDDPQQTLVVLSKSVENLLRTLRELSFEDRELAFAGKLPEIVSSLKDLSLAVDFLRAPTSKGALPADSEFFQMEVSAALRTCEAFLSFEFVNLTFPDWSSLSRTVASLNVALQDFVERYSEQTGANKRNYQCPPYASE
ncbi:MAG: hypothetical protein KDD60_00825 [Bdellovibrionales bacterium]|nr:hypothetical protein [Bdellovibrionales bacterium]